VDDPAEPVQVEERDDHRDRREKKMPTMTPASSRVWIDSSRPIAAMR